MNTTIVVGILAEEAYGLTSRHCRSSQELTLFTRPYNCPPSDYAFTVSNVNLSTSAGDYNKLADLVRKKLRASSAVTCLIPTLCDNVPLPTQLSKAHTVDYIVNSTRVEGLMITENGRPCPIFNIYVRPPTVNPAQYESWLNKIKSISYVSIFGLADIINSYHCNLCKGSDHPTSLCPYTIIPD